MQECEEWLEQAHVPDSQRSSKEATRGVSRSKSSRSESRELRITRVGSWVWVAGEEGGLRSCEKPAGAVEEL